MSIDWKAVHERLANNRAIIERELQYTPDEIKRILIARAKTLAQHSAVSHAAGETLDVLEFKLAYENYGIELPFIQEVLPLKSLTPIPGTPPFVVGIINVRGQVFSVLDLKKIFELPEKGLSDSNKVIIIRYNGAEFGILTDTVVGIRTIQNVEIQTSLPTLTGVRQEYLKGITREQLILLDASKLLTDKTLTVNQVDLR